jgi:hypothetical protein
VAADVGEFGSPTLDDQHVLGDRGGLAARSAGGPPGPGGPDVARRRREQRDHPIGPRGLRRLERRLHAPVGVRPRLGAAGLDAGLVQHRDRDALLRERDVPRIAQLSGHPHTRPRPHRVAVHSEARGIEGRIPREPAQRAVPEPLVHRVVLPAGLRLHPPAPGLVGGQGEHASPAALAEDEHGRGPPALIPQRRVLEQDARLVARATEAVDARELGQRAPERSGARVVGPQRDDRVPHGVGAERGAERAEIDPLILRCGARGQRDGEHVRERCLRVTSVREGEIPAEHRERAASEHEVADAGQIAGHLVRAELEILEEDHVEGAEVLAEQLVGGKRDEREFVRRGHREIRGRAEDEERHEIDGRIAPQERAEKPLLPARASAHQQHAKLVPHDADHERALVVLRDDVLIHDGHRDGERVAAEAVEHERQVHRRLSTGRDVDDRFAHDGAAPAQRDDPRPAPRRAHGHARTPRLAHEGRRVRLHVDDGVVGQILGGRHRDGVDADAEAPEGVEVDARALGRRAGAGGTRGDRRPVRTVGDDHDRPNVGVVVDDAPEGGDDARVVVDRCER